MKRVEIIGNRSIEEDLFDVLRKHKVANHYTKIPIVHGIGNSGPKHGDHIWPEENFLIIVYCDDEEAKNIMKAVKEVKSYFKDEGLKLFETELVCSV